jgi:hypothetical protein
MIVMTRPTERLNDIDRLMTEAGSMAVDGDVLLAEAEAMTAGSARRSAGAWPRTRRTRHAPFDEGLCTATGRSARPPPG